MKLSLGMISWNDRYYLSHTLPIIRDMFDDFVAVDSGSTDGTLDVLKEHGAKIVHRPWDNHYADARNEVLNHVKGDWIVFLDTDECMFPRDIRYLQRFFSKKPILGVPTYHFVHDHKNYNPDSWPDIHYRIFELGQGFWFRGNIHEGVFKGKEPHGVWKTNHFMNVMEVPIYHYGWAKPWRRRWMKLVNYDRLKDGKPRLTQPPADAQQVVYKSARPFPWSHPLQHIPPEEPYAPPS